MILHCFPDGVVDGAAAGVETSFGSGFDLDQRPRADVHKLSEFCLRNIQEAARRPDHRRAYRGIFDGFCFRQWESLVNGELTLTNFSFT